MSPCAAPTARRTPISLTRSVTDTSMMFMITMPPTMAATADSMRNTMKKLPMMSSNSFMVVSAVLMEKSSFISYFRPRSTRRKTRTSSIAWPKVSGEAV